MKPETPKRTGALELLTEAINNRDRTRTEADETIRETAMKEQGYDVELLKRADVVPSSVLIFFSIDEISQESRDKYKAVYALPVIDMICGKLYRYVVFKHGAKYTL